jgi:hypothetical protein
MKKCDIGIRISNAYKDNDRDALSDIVKTLDEIKVLLDKYEEIMYSMWVREYKIFGWNLHCAYLGKVRALITNAMRRITQYLNGELALCGDGHGAYWFFDSIYDVKVEDYPCIVLDGEVTVSARENVQIGAAYIYDLNFEKTEYSGGFEGLSDLPAGEYLVVFTEYHDGSLADPAAEEYWKTMYESRKKNSFSENLKFGLIGFGSGLLFGGYAGITIGIKIPIN